MDPAPEAQSARRPPRRAPRPEERGRAAERTRERILDAAVEEFGRKGYAGARTAGIAARAGVNQQLISYHFGGKRGLLDELRRRWEETEATLVPSDASFAEATRAYLDATLDRPDWARLVIWQALGDQLDEDGDSAAERARARDGALAAAVERVRRRQDDGEITADVDPEFVLLLTYALTFAPIAMPGIAGALAGGDPLAPEHRHRWHDQLLRLVDPRRGGGAPGQRPGPGPDAGPDAGPERGTEPGPGAGPDRPGGQR